MLSGMAAPWPISSFPAFLFHRSDHGFFPRETGNNAARATCGCINISLTASAVLFFLGLVTCSWFIFGWLFQAICPPAVTQKSIWAILLSPPDNPEVYFFSLANLRITGVLQRIALVYLAMCDSPDPYPLARPGALLPAPCCSSTGV